MHEVSQCAPMVQPTKASIGGTEANRFLMLWDAGNRPLLTVSERVRFTDIDGMNVETRGGLVEFMMRLGWVAPFYPSAFEAWGTGRIQMMHRILSDKSMKEVTEDRVHEWFRRRAAEGTLCDI